MFFKVCCRPKAVRKRMSFARRRAYLSKKPCVARLASSPSPSAPAGRIHLSQGERPWQKDEVCVDCQGLPLWGSWHRVAMTERASLLKQEHIEKAAAQQLVQQPEGQIISAAFRRRLLRLPRIRRRRSRSCRHRKALPVWGRWGTWPAQAGCALRQPRPHDCCQTH